MNENIKDKIAKAKIQVMKKNSFYGYIFLNIDMIESDKKSIKTACIDPKGRMYYCKEFVESISDKELVGLLLHETLHMAFLTFARKGNREKELWNVTTDIAINYIILSDGISLPKTALLPEGNEIKIVVDGCPNLIIKNLDKKTSEDIYQELETYCDDNNLKFINNITFDEHSYDGDEKDFRKWEGIVQDGVTISKMRGDLPGDLESILDKIHNPKINWRNKIKKSIKEEIPYNQSYGKFNKKSVPLRTYIPGHVKESKFDVIFAIDTSGSISKEDFEDFFSEIVGLSKEFRENINIRVITHDTAVHEDIDVGRNKDYSKIKVTGGGGTSHTGVFEYIKDNYKNSKLVIFQTDGYSDIENIDLNKYKFNKIFLIAKEGKNEIKTNGECSILNL